MTATGAPAAGPPDDDAWPADAVEVGRVVDAWGVKGWIKVQPYAAEPQALGGRGLAADDVIGQQRGTLHHGLAGERAQFVDHAGL